MANVDVNITAEKKVIIPVLMAPEYLLKKINTPFGA